MTNLPVCHYWIFSNAGLLIEDWLLQPPRPLDLTNSWRRTTLESIVREQPFEPIPNETLQIVLYFAFPLLPILTILIALINIVHESKNYMCPRKFLASRPFITRLSHSLMVFFVLALITSTLTWTGCLMRYIPMSPYAEQHTSTSRSTDRSLSLITNRTTSHASTVRPLQGTHFVAQLPAILTMQAVLRLTVIWITLGLMTDRIWVLNRLIQHPTGIRIRSYVRTIHELCGLNCHDDLCPMRFFFTQPKYGSDRSDTRSFPVNVNINQSPNPKPNYFMEAAKGVCVCFRETTCHECFDPDCSHKSRKTLCRWSSQKHNGTWRTRHKVEPTDPGLNGSCSTRKRMFSETTCSAGQTCMTTGFLICLSLGMCLPQLWAYQLSRFDKNMDSTARPRKWMTWQLTNRTGRALYEYGLAIVGFVLPGCLLLASVMLLVTKLWIVGKQLKRLLMPEQNTGDKYSWTAHERLAAYCVTCISRDSFLVLLLGLIYVLCWLPHAAVTTVHRLNCLLNTDTNGVFRWLDRNTWPMQVGWLWIELILLVGDLLSQLVLLFTRLCEPVCKILTRETKVRSHGRNSPEELAIDGDENLEGVPDELLVEDNEEMDYPGRHNPTGNSSLQSPILSKSHMPTQISVQRQQQQQQSRTMVPLLVASDDGQTSQNISPLPTSHTLSESNQPVQFRAGQNYPIMRHLEARSCHSNPSPYPSPLTARIPSCRGHEEPASLQLHPTQMSYNEPRSSTVLLTYSPRSRHPCRIRPEPARCFHPPPPNSPNSQCTYWPSHPSPPPLPPPPRHLTSMIGADSSIYSTPHGSPNEQLFRSPCQNRAVNNHVQVGNKSGTDDEEEEDDNPETDVRTVRDSELV
ncbi:hypothetical protein D915_000309 [Fasciola hepatica]|uniref:G-protein coupled receptors family 1 profile domain-containing protein n=1 Tax=Fasciola hepatica TaxID=6192 RepID=A0A2H1CWK7_FASHE|nr:hypothetical protein D915_000309 [Fasciola hepatica]